MVSSSRAWGALVVVAMATLAAGCGGGSSGGSSALTKAQIDTKADAICTAEAKAGSAVPAPNATTIKNPKTAAAYFDKVDPIISGATTKLEALKPDSSVATDWNSFISLRKQESALIHTVRTKADAKDPSGLTQLENSSALGAKVDAAATKVGAASCAE